jgi:hypothetical protein
MRPSEVEIREAVFSQHALEMTLTEHDHVVQAFSGTGRGANERRDVLRRLGPPGVVVEVGISDGRDRLAPVWDRRVGLGEAEPMVLNCSAIGAVFTSHVESVLRGGACADPSRDHSACMRIRNEHRRRLTGRVHGTRL